MTLHYLHELNKSAYRVLEGGERMYIERKTFEAVGDYTRSCPTSPSVGRVYRKNLGWPDDMPDCWYVYVCVAGEGDDDGWVLHRPHRVVIVESMIDELTIAEEPV